MRKIVDGERDIGMKNSELPLQSESEERYIGHWSSGVEKWGERK